MATPVGKVLSVNVGSVREFEYGGRPARSAIHGRFNSRSADGKQRRGRYTDNYARRDGTWVAVSGHYNLDRDG